MASMTRDRAIERLNRCREILEITSHMDNQNRKAFDMAISDMKRVKELEELGNRWRDEFLKSCHTIDDALNKIQTLEAENEELSIKLANAEDEIEGLKEELANAREEINGC